MLEKLELFPYEIPWSSSDKPRKGVICKLFYQDGKIGYGEAAPLPSWSQETFVQVLRQLEKVVASVQNKEEIHWDNLYPSVHFALQEPIFADEALQPQKFHGFLFGTLREILENSHKLSRDNVDFVKVKISQLKPSEITTLIKELAPRFKLRLDANRAFSYQEAENLFTPFRSYIDYVEDPTHEEAQLANLSFPFALDESRAFLHHKEVRKNPHLKAVIVKPTLLGGRSRWDFIPGSVEVIMGTCWETSIGLSQLIKLHQLLNSSQRPAGLDTLRFLQEEKPCLVTKGCYHFFSPEQWLSLETQ